MEILLKWKNQWLGSKISVTVLFLIILDSHTSTSLLSTVIAVLSVINFFEI